MDNKEKEMVEICHIAMMLNNKLWKCNDIYFVDKILDAVYNNKDDIIQDLLLNYIPL